MNQLAKRTYYLFFYFKIFVSSVKAFSPKLIEIFHDEYSLKTFKIIVKEKISCLEHVEVEKIRLFSFSGIEIL